MHCLTALIIENHDITYVLLFFKKVGGSVIQWSHLFDDARQYHPVGGHHVIAEYYHHAKERQIVLDNKDNDVDFETFSIVRHPCERFMSTYAALTSKKANSVDKAWAQKHIGNMNVHEWAQHVLLQASISITGNNDHEKQRTPLLSLHFMPMHKYIFGWTHSSIHDKIKQWYAPNHLFCHEQFDSVVDWINETFGQQQHHDHQEEEILTQTMMVQHHHHHHHEETASCSLLSTETRTLIEETYALDYCIFGYAMSSTTNKDQYYLLETDRGTECPVAHLDKDELFERYFSCRILLEKSRN